MLLDWEDSIAEAERDLWYLVRDYRKDRLPKAAEPLHLNRAGTPSRTVVVPWRFAPLTGRIEPVP